jgi:hypothetical protein
MKNRFQIGTSVGSRTSEAVPLMQEHDRRVRHRQPSAASLIRAAADY